MVLVDMPVNVSIWRGRNGRSPRETRRGFAAPYCLAVSGYGNLVCVTRIKLPKLTNHPRRARTARSGYWLLQDAKARLSELVRRVRSEGPQHVTVHGREEVVVISAEDYRRLKGGPTGKALIAALQASPDRDIDIEPRRSAFPVRDAAL
jgi:prevent-host-death family protein